jgi:hypothetical protein
MQLVTFTLAMHYNSQLVRPGSVAVMYNSEVVALREMKAPIRVEPVEVPHAVRGKRVESLLVLASGGLGDRIQATPALRELAKRTATGTVDVWCPKPMPEYAYLPYVRQMTVGVVPSWVMASYSDVITWEGIIDEDQATKVPLHRLFAQYAGIKLRKGEEEPDYAFREWETALDPLGHLEQKPRLVFHIGCHGPARGWPADRWIDLAMRFREDYLVALIGGPNEGPVWEAVIGSQRYSIPPPEGVFDLCGWLPDVRYMAATIRPAACFVGVDSGPLHLTGALGVPAVGLYGSFGYKLRGANLPTVSPLELLPPRVECPCYSHARPGEELPCKQQFCSMMTGLSVNAVESEVRRVLHDTRESGREAA